MYLECQSLNSTFLLLGGDCVICNSKVSAEAMDRIGDGVCHSDILLVEECSLDGEDCLQFFNMYPECDVQYPEKVGDSTCDPVPYYTEECGWDGGDCENCQVEDRSQLGDGECLVQSVGMFYL